MQLGPYELTAEVGRGAFGIVFRARSREGRVVAVKVIRSTVDGAGIARELRLLGDLGPEQGFVGLIDSGVTPQGCYVVMPFLGGGTLRDRLRKGPLSVAETLALGKTLARALGAAHGKGIVHRDLKPENVLFAEDGAAFVGDLGLAKHFRKDLGGASLSLSFSQGGGMKGTIGYAPPEQLRESKDVGPPADIFALGAILYECLAGAPAFSGETPLHVLDKVERDTREPLSRLRPDVPRSLLSVIERTLSRDPAKRFPDGAALLLALESGSLTRRPPLLLAAPLFAILALALALALALPRTPTPPTTSPPSPPPAPLASSSTSDSLLPLPPPGTFPPQCDSFLRGKRHLRLVQLIGDYGFKVAGEVHALAYSPDGTKLLSGQGHLDKGERHWGEMLDRTLVLWDAASGQELRRFRGHVHGVTGCGFLTDERIVSGSFDGTVRIWDAAKGTGVGVLETGAPVLALAVTRDGSAVAVGLLDGRVLFYDLAKGEKPVVLGEQREACLSVAFSEDGALLVAGSADGAARFWDAGAARRGEAVERRAYRVGTPVRAVAFLRDSRRAALCGESGDLWVADSAAESLVPRRDSSPAPIEAIVAVQSTFYTVHRTGSVRHRSGDDLNLLGTLDDRPGPLEAIAATPDGKLAWGGRNEEITTIVPGASAPTVPHKATRIALSKVDGVEQIATGGSDARVCVWDGATGKNVWSSGQRGSVFLSVAFAPNGKRIATASESGLVRLWNASTSHMEMTFERGKGSVYRVAFTAHGDRVVSCGDSGVIYVWDVVGDARELTGHTARVFCVALHPDGKRLLSCSQDRSVRIWDVERGLELRRIPNAHKELVGNLAISPDGERFVTMSWDKTVKVWNTSTGALVKELSDQPHIPWGLGWLDSKRVIVGCYDGSIAVWDAASATKLDEVKLDSAVDWSGNIVPVGDGKHFLAGTGRGVVLRFSFE